MRNGSYSRSIFVLLTLAMVLCATAATAMVREVTFQELTELSETTMEVVVVNSYAKWNAEHTAIFTHYVVEPIRQSGGRNRGASFELLFAGGRADDGKQMIVTEVPQLEVGGQYILFLHPSTVRHAAATVGMWQGALRVVRDPETRNLVVVDANGRLIEKDAAGNLFRGRRVHVDANGALTAAAAIEPEPGMEADPVLTDPEGRVVPMPRVQTSELRAEPQGQVVDPDTFMSMVDGFRHKSSGPRTHGTE